MSEYQPIKKLLNEFKEAQEANHKIAQKVEARKDKYGQPVGRPKEISSYQDNTKRIAEIRTEINQRGEFAKRKGDYKVGK